MTRTLLYLVYGRLNIDLPKNKKILKSYGMAPILKHHTPQTIKRAQKKLREETLRQAQHINLGCELGNRRIKNKDDFRIYFQTFL